MQRAIGKPVGYLKKTGKRRLRVDPIDVFRYMKGYLMEKKVLCCCIGNKQRVLEKLLTCEYLL